MKYREDFPPTEYNEDFPSTQTPSSSPLHEDRFEQRSLIHQDKDRCRFNSVSKSIFII